jgi:hypothetical protein
MNVLRKWGFNVAVLVIAMLAAIGGWEVYKGTTGKVQAESTTPGSLQVLRLQSQGGESAGQRENSFYQQSIWVGTIGNQEGKAALLAYRQEPVD